MATRVASIVADIGINTGKFDKGVQSVLKSLGLMKGDFAKFGLAVGAAGVVIGAVATQMKKAVDVTVTYADEVRTLSSVTNQSAEQTSRMIQVLDDYKISAEQAGSAARFLAKEGLSLNVETLAKLSDEYKKLNSGQERAEFLMKKFGKAGQDFALIMEQGSEAILEQGDAVNKGLILTEKQIRQARELEIAQDNLNDTQQALTVTLGTKLIPLWSDYLDSLNDVLSGTSVLDVVWKNFIWTLDQLRGRGEMNVTTLEEMATAQTNYYNSLQGLPTIIEDIGDEIGGLSDAEESFLTSTREMTPKAVAEFVTLQTKIGEVKRMIAAGASFNVIVNFLAGKTIVVDPNSISLPPYIPTPVVPTTPKTVNKPKTTQRASGGLIGEGWTMVGEQGFELIDPTGMVHSNANSKRLLKMGVTPFKKLAQGGDDWGVSSLPAGGDDVNWNLSNEFRTLQGSFGGGVGGGGVGGGGGASAVVQTSQATSQAASQAAQQASRAVDVTAQMASQQALAAAQQAASLASIDRRLANLPTQIRDAFQQVIQQ